MSLFIFFYFLLIFSLLSTSIENCYCSSFSTSFLFFPSSPHPLKSVLVHISLLSSYSFSSSYPSKSDLVHLFLLSSYFSPPLHIHRKVVLFIFFYFLLIFPLLSTSIEKCSCSSFSTFFLFFPSSLHPLKSVLVHLFLLSSYFSPPLHVH